MSKRGESGLNRHHRIKFSGTPTEEDLVSSRDMLLDALGKYDAIAVDCGDVSGAGLGLIQLILSARKSADAAGKKLSLAEPARGPLLAALQSAGFANTTGTTAVPDQEFWLAEPT